MLTVKFASLQGAFPILCRCDFVTLGLLCLKIEIYHAICTITKIVHMKDKDHDCG